jgi:hypothetical protein
MYGVFLFTVGEHKVEITENELKWKTMEEAYESAQCPAL